MRTTRMIAAALLALAAAAAAGPLVAAPDFKKGLEKPTQDGFASVRKVAKGWFASGKFPPQSALDNVTKAENDLIKAFVDGCPAFDRMSFSDASHSVDVKALKGWKLETAVPASAVGVNGGAHRFHASWSAKANADTPEVSVTFSALPQRVYDAGKVQEPVTKFEELSRDVKAAQVADLLQALADDWARTNPNAVVVKPAKKTVGVAKWFASATAKVGDTAETTRRDWFAWETGGVSWTVQGTTWVATVVFSNAAAADPKLAAKPEELLKHIDAVLE